MSEATGIGWLREDEFARIGGLPFADGETDWHVNEHLVAMTGPQALEDILQGMLTGGPPRGAEDVEQWVLQRADASPEWLVFVVEGNEIAEARYVDGMNSSPEAFDSESVEVLAIGETEGDLDA